MKKWIATLACFCLLSVSAQAQKYVPTPENLQNRKEFAESRLGIFIHWGLYSTFAQGEWYMNNASVDAREYAKAMNGFYPHRFDARQWVSAFKAAGAKYICFTTRHHEGFSMWDTRWSDYNIMNTPYGKDIVRQLAEECHRQGIKLHLYYSHIDWTREDYPAGRTGRGTKRLDRADWPAYYRFMNNQLTELLTNYGEIGAIWFDGWWDHDVDSVPFNWELEEQYKLIHDLQPGCLVGNNHHQTPFEGEDIQIFERDVPGENKAGLSGQDISALPLETCQTMNHSWGYRVTDQEYKSTRELIQLLVRTSGKGANLLLNVGPQPDGTLPEAALTRLAEMGKWLDRYGESIYATVAGDYREGDNLITTRNGNVLYVHILNTDIEQVKMPVAQKVKSVEVLGEGTRIDYKCKKGVLDFGVEIPDDCIDYVVKVTLK
ncbi:alpha-L-fucosidase [Barnesiella sp. An22]|uniref:alpha-L-fucosidase n=1 Tax=Barnesiella sp. An22 TaxID=1965590 RepID=UPI000B37FB9C|nr:alpha-L-fucosidase [Barnesiella sp. An22]OUO97959.1 alpha-L-fucosidase [Barnesiella sp. An22]